MPPKAKVEEKPCRGCARSREDRADPDNAFCVACSRKAERPDNYITMSAYQSLVLKGLYGR